MNVLRKIEEKICRIYAGNNRENLAEIIDSYSENPRLKLVIEWLVVI